ncbi:MAG TPA: restriction endonuclease subunit S [Candidatus Margulisiibacteriota bacterium]|nr:restriction endonuclease subunit S [Candidatus Margulisiibacteriota bacterium]
METLCDTNPETLGPATPPDFEFDYLDISAVERGRIDSSSIRRVKFRDAPSRARRVVRSGDVLLCTVRPGLQSHAQIGERQTGHLVCSTGFAVLRAKEQVADPHFIFHQLFSETISAQLRALETGSNYPAVNEADVRRLLVPAPDPSEQRVIATLLDTVDEAIAKTEAVIAKLKQVRAGLLHDLLTRGLDEHGDLRDPEAHPEQFQDSGLGRIPREWRVRRLCEVASFQNGKAFPSADYRNSGIRLLRPGNLPPSEFVSWEPGNTVCLPESWADIALEYLVRGEEIVMNLTAQSLEEAFLGRVCITRPDEQCLLNQRLARFRPLDCHLPFLFWTLRGPFFRHQINRNPQGTKVQHIYNRDLEAVVLPMPLRRAEQELVASVLFTVADQIESEGSLLTKLQVVKAGLMTDLLTGRVHVPSGIGA